MPDEKGNIDRSALALSIAVDREVSRDEIESRYYPHADRDLFSYRRMIPSLDAVLSFLSKSGKVIRGLDAGCGTGRAAAEMMEAYPSLDMRGITLIFHPPVQDHKFLPKEKIKICHAGNTGYSDQSFDFIVAVGSLDTSWTISSGGMGLLNLVAENGYFILSPAVYREDDPDIEELVTYAKNSGFSVSQDLNAQGCHNFIFCRAASPQAK